MGEGDARLGGLQRVEQPAWLPKHRNHAGNVSRHQLEPEQGYGGEKVVGIIEEGSRRGLSAPRCVHPFVTAQPARPSHHSKGRINHLNRR
jgi:hypothetical protein